MRKLALLFFLFTTLLSNLSFAQDDMFDNFFGYPYEYIIQDAYEQEAEYERNMILIKDKKEKKQALKDFAMGSVNVAFSVALAKEMVATAGYTSGFQTIDLMLTGFQGGMALFAAGTGGYYIGKAIVKADKVYFEGKFVHSVGQNIVGPTVQFVGKVKNVYKKVID